MYVNGSKLKQRKIKSGSKDTLNCNSHTIGYYLHIIHLEHTIKNSTMI